ncbi:MAG: ice-binding family protein [Bacteroidales bacterium]|nr:ice-binding family protein [Bacteroidales bacterium]
MKRKLPFIVATIILFLTTTVSFGQTAPNLGATSNFALFTAVGAFNGDGASTITGDIGTNAGAFTGPGTLVGVSHVADAVSATAATDVATAYTDLYSRVHDDVIEIELAGQTLNQGVHSTGAAATLNGNLTLDGQGNPNAIFIIQIDGALTTSTSSNIILINSASPNNVYWQINGQFDLDNNAVFRGTIVANGAINLLEGSKLFGRGLTKAGAITLHNNTITIPTYFRSQASGDWNKKETWQSSSDSITWVDTVEFPTADAISINISNEHTVTITDNSTASILTINPGAHLTLNSGQTLTATIFNINSDATNGTGTFLNNGTLNATTTNVEQYLSSARNWYVSSPVSNALAPSGYTYYNYNEAGNNWGSTVTSFTKGVGYIALPGSPGSTLTFTTQTGGTLNSGNVDVTLTKSGATKTGFNLIGNPYPAHLTWTQTFVDNNSTRIEPTIWYRTNAGTVNNGGDASWSFKTINASTGEASPLGTTAIIPPMQAFWVRAVSAGTLTLNNDLTLSHQASNPLKAPAINNSDDRQRLRLQVNNGTSTDEALIYFDANASNGYDRYDSPKFEDATTATQIYTTAGTEKLVINGMNSIPLNTEIGFGFVPGNAASFSIMANEVSNLPSDVKVILKDNVTLAETDLTNGVTTYQFSPATITTDRFSIIFRTPGAVTGIPTAANDPNLLVYRNANNQIAVQIKGQLNDSYSLDVYNSVGQRLTSKQATAGVTIMDVPQSGVYFVAIKGNGNETTKKVVIN